MKWGGGRGSTIQVASTGITQGTEMRWTAERMDQLERAVRDGLRVALSRRGSEFIVVARRITSVAQRDALVGRLPMTNEDKTFILDGFSILSA